MESRKIDMINIGLAITSLIIAIKIPFRLFLISYAILGPLHYLTEIAWLHKKNYFFSANKKWALVFVLLAVLMSLFPTIKFSGLILNSITEDAITIIAEHSGVLILIGFLFALSLLFLVKTKNLIITLLCVISISFIAFVYLPQFIFFIAVFLPTLVHVYFLTLIFILYGALKTRSNYGIYTALIILSAPIIITYIPIDTLDYRQIYSETYYPSLNSFITLLGTEMTSLLDKPYLGEYRLSSEIGVRIQIFIAFAYTYHYLNWFSKTSIIGWRQSVSMENTFLILFLWVLFVGLYIYDFKTGFTASFFLSLLHVLLEFPLNAKSIKGIFQQKNLIK